MGSDTPTHPEPAESGRDPNLSSVVRERLRNRMQRSQRELPPSPEVSKENLKSELLDKLRDEYVC